MSKIIIVQRHPLFGPQETSFFSFSVLALALKDPFFDLATPSWEDDDEEEEVLGGRALRFLLSTGRITGTGAAEADEDDDVPKGPMPALLAPLPAPLTASDLASDLGLAALAPLIGLGLDASLTASDLGLDAPLTASDLLGLGLAALAPASASAPPSAASPAPALGAGLRPAMAASARVAASSSSKAAESFIVFIVVEGPAPKSGLVPRILKGLSQERACPKNFEGPVPREGLSQEFAIINVSAKLGAKMDMVHLRTFAWEL